MKACPRCKGNMYHETVICEKGRCTGYSCIHCGEWIDSEILNNRNPSVLKMLMVETSLEMGRLGRKSVYGRYMDRGR